MSDEEAPGEDGDGEEGGDGHDELEWFGGWGAFAEAFAEESLQLVGAPGDDFGVVGAFQALGDDFDEGGRETGFVKEFDVGICQSMVSHEFAGEEFEEDDTEGFGVAIAEVGVTGFGAEEGDVILFVDGDGGGGEVFEEALFVVPAGEGAADLEADGDLFAETAGDAVADSIFE